MNNRIKKLREKAGLSQRDLAAKAGTSQAQLQRIEAGTQEVRLETATRICFALEKSLDQVFPSAKKTIVSLGKDNASLLEAIEDERLRGELGRAGLDLDPALWSLKYRLRGGHNGSLRISGSVKDRLWELFQRRVDENETADFVAFRSDSTEVAVNVRHLLFWQFLFDFGSEEQPESPDSFSANNARFYLADGARLGFDVEPDAENYVGEEREGEEAVPFHSVISDLESIGDLMEVISFTDVDDETAFIRTSEIALAEIDRDVVEPDVDLDAHEDERGDE